MLFLGLGTQVLFGLTSTPPLALVASMILIAVFLFENRMISGVRLTLIGLLLNIVVIVANGRMPVSGQAVQSMSLADVPLSDLRHGIADSGSFLSFLGDVIPAGGGVFSIGDILMAVGLFVFLFCQARRAYLVFA